MMTSEAKRPRLILYSLLLPVLWLSFGYALTYLAKGKRLGAMGLLLVVYATTTIIAWHFAKSYKRQFTKAERLKLIAYCTIWTVATEMLSLYSLVSEDPRASSLSGKAILGLVGFTVLMDALIIWAGFTHYANRVIESCLRKTSPAVT